MYKLLIVDDEEFERAALANYIAWADYDIELIGTAWNGVQALEMIENQIPDIIITDINMPIMNGFELIKSVRDIKEDIGIIIISGHSEFEYTSNAIKDGIRHYILKPFSDENIIETIEQVKAEIDLNNNRIIESTKYNMMMNKLMVRAKEQVFRNVLLKRELIENDYISFCEEFMQKDNYVFLLAIRTDLTGFDYLEQFVAENVLLEMLCNPENILSTVINNDIIFMIPADLLTDIKPAIECVLSELGKVKIAGFKVCISRIGEVSEITSLYHQINGLFLLNKSTKNEKFIYYSLYNDKEKKSIDLFDYNRLNTLMNPNDILFELYLSHIKLKRASYSVSEQNDICNTVINILFTINMSNDFLLDEKNEWHLIEKMFRIILKEKNQINETDKNLIRNQNILLSIYQNIYNPMLSIQFLTKEILFMNEDYFGRIFFKLNNIKFSTFLSNTRIKLAKRMLDETPDIKISDLAELVGFSPDGQYFSKTFKKIVGMTPADYRNQARHNLQ